MRTIKQTKQYIEKYKTKINLKEIDEGKYLYKKSFKYQISKLFKVIKMVLWIPLWIMLCIPISILIGIFESLKDLLSEILELFTQNELKKYLYNIKEEFESILPCIIEIKDNK